MEWLENLWAWLNEPLPIVGISILMITFIVIKFLSTTSIGKRAIKQFNQKTNEVIDKFDELTHKTSYFTSEIDKKVILLKDEYETRLKTVYTQFDFFEKSIMEILKQIPNAKVQAEVSKFEEEYLAKKEEIGLIVCENYELIQQKLDEIEELKAKMLQEFEEIKDEARRRIDNKTEEE